MKLRAMLMIGCLSINIGAAEEMTSDAPESEELSEETAFNRMLHSRKLPGRWYNNTDQNVVVNSAGPDVSLEPHTFAFISFPRTGLNLKKKIFNITFQKNGGKLEMNQMNLLTDAYIIIIEEDNQKPSGLAARQISQKEFNEKYLKEVREGAPMLPGGVCNIIMDYNIGKKEEPKEEAAE